MREPRRWEIVRRWADVYMMRADGLTFAEIGRRLGISGNRARVIDEATDRRIAIHMAGVRYHRAPGPRRYPW